MSRSIPACAGEPRLPGPQHPARRVYPRMRGGAVMVAMYVGAKLGLSPHARGSLPSGTRLATCCGSIPACAGEPVSIGHNPHLNEVYPRMRGGANTAFT